MTEHHLKTLPHYYDAVTSGAKTFEIRRNDRAFQTGDYVVLVRMHDATDKAASFRTRPWARVLITYVFAGDPSLGPECGGIARGYVVLGLGEAEMEAKR